MLFLEPLEQLQRSREDRVWLPFGWRAAEGMNPGRASPEIYFAIATKSTLLFVRDQTRDRQPQCKSIGDPQHPLLHQCPGPVQAARAGSHARDRGGQGRNAEFLMPGAA